MSAGSIRRSAAASGTCSPMATISSAARHSGSIRRRRSSTRSRSRSLVPALSTMRPAVPVARRSTAVVTSSRTNRTLPWLSCQIRSSSDAGTASPSTVTTSSSVASRGSGPTSSRVSSSSFHSPTRPWGTGSPVRTLTSARTGDCVSARCRSAIDTSSSRWASSTASTNGPAPARSRSPVSARWSRSSGWCAPSLGARTWANDPSGISRAASVARTHSTDAPASRSASTASSTRRVLPTPASPNRATPRLVASAPRRRRSSASSRARPTRGQRATTPGMLPTPGIRSSY